MSRKTGTGGIDNPTYDSYESGEGINQGKSLFPAPVGDDSQPINVISTKPIIDSRRQMSVIAEPVSMSWHNIDVFSQKTGGGLSLPCKKGDQKPPVHILKNGMQKYLLPYHLGYDH